jgi:hypothetical protein
MDSWTLEVPILEQLPEMTMKTEINLFEVRCIILETWEDPPVTMPGAINRVAIPTTSPWFELSST